MQTEPIDTEMEAELTAFWELTETPNFLLILLNPFVQIMCETREIIAQIVL